MKTDLMMTFPRGRISVPPAVVALNIAEKMMGESTRLAQEEMGSPPIPQFGAFLQGGGTKPGTSHHSPGCLLCTRTRVSAHLPPASVSLRSSGFCAVRCRTPREIGCAAPDRDAVDKGSHCRVHQHPCPAVSGDAGLEFPQVDVAEQRTVRGSMDLMAGSFRSCCCFFPFLCFSFLLFPFSSFFFFVFLGENNFFLFRQRLYPLFIVDCRLLGGQCQIPILADARATFDLVWSRLYSLCLEIAD